MAPINLREALVELIRNEIENARAGGKASIMAKLNSLVDPEIIKELYEASNAGVIIRLNIRGICCLRPGVPGLSENIRVVSIVDRFLEHSRIVHFHHGGDQKVFITSADWMGRNLDKRVELLVPINDPDCRQRILNVVDLYFQGNVNTWELNSEGQYVRIAHRPKYEFRPQAEIYQWFVEKNEASVTEQGTLFKPIRGKD
jgi:polyphosphate kinase